MRDRVWVYTSAVKEMVLQVPQQKPFQIALYSNLADQNNVPCKLKITKRSSWNSSTKLDTMNSVNNNGSLDLLPSAEETVTPVGAPMKAFQANQNGKRTLKLSTSQDDAEIWADVKIYDIWTHKLAKDSVSAELALKSLKRLAYDGLDVFCDRLVVLEKLSSEDEICLLVHSHLDTGVLMENQKEIEDASTEETMSDLESEFRQISKAFQNIAQFLPPGPQRASLKSRISYVRKRFYTMLNDLHRKKELLRRIIPLLQQYKDTGSDIKNWLDVTETRSDPFIKCYNNHKLVLKHEETIKAIYQEIYVKKDVYENFLEAGEKVLDMNEDHNLPELRQDLDDVIVRWDALVSSMEKCINRLTVAKLTEKNSNNDVEKIEQKIRQEAQKCQCHQAFQIIKVGDGKYTFGTSKIVRLVRIHGSSIVVRVGGGWEYLYDFLLKADPCRAKQVAKKGSTSLHLAGLNLTPIDKKNGEQFSLNVQRMSQSSWDPSFRSKLNRSGSVGSAASSDNTDGFDESSDLSHMSTSTDATTPHSRPNSRINYTPRGSTPLRKTSSNNKLSQSLNHLPNSKPRPARKSLMERQNEYADKQKLLRSMTLDK